MNRVLSREQIRSFDRHAIEVCKVPGIVLMENAGRGAAEIILQRVARPGARVGIVCGAGNNGGDGFVVARHLSMQEIQASVWFVGDPASLEGDAAANHLAYVGLGGRVTAIRNQEDLASFREALRDLDAIVDAVFGTGLDRDIGEPHATIIGWMNDAPAARFALDLPSGIDANTGVVRGVAVRAQCTITFGALKLGMLTPSGAEHCGEIQVAGLGVPRSVLDAVGHDAELITSAEIAQLLSPRGLGAHKHAAGDVLIVAGSHGKIGASLLAARGALRAGAGLCTIASWPEAVDALESRVLEIMTARIDLARIEESLDQLLTGRRAVAIGPGFGVDERARRAVEHVVMRWDGIKVVDADAITLLAGNADALRSARGQIILTPHAGEMARLLNITSADVERDRFACVRKAVERTRAVVALKGAHTLVGIPGRPTAINPSAVPALATAGSGDVLTGIIAALTCAMAPADAARTGVHLHGLAGEAWQAAHRIDRGMIAGDIADAVPDVLARLVSTEATAD